MAAGRKEDAWFLEVELLFVVFLIVLFFVLGKIAIFPRFALFVVFFVFVNVDFGGTFRAADHGSILRTCIKSRRRQDCEHHR